jgi:CubicO group peptidase (beta-lactamase class C family)
MKIAIRPIAFVLTTLFFTAKSFSANEPVLPGIRPAMEEMIAKDEIAGCVTVVVNKDKVLHLEVDGFADILNKKNITSDSLFWIASMTKPVTAVAILMLQDEGKLNINDPVSKFIPEFAGLKTPSGKDANLTIKQILTHTSGLGEAGAALALKAKTLGELVPIWLSTPMQYEPGTKWKYTQSGINAASRIVEIVSGKSFDAFLKERLFEPLGMKDTTFYPTDEQKTRLATGYAKNKDTGALEPAPLRPNYDGSRNNPPQGNGGLFSTGPDYARFCQMLLGGGAFEGRRFLSEASLKLMCTPQTDELPTGFFQNDTFGQRGTHYGWGIGTCVLQKPHDGVAEMLAPGSFGHGGAWGTQAWMDPVRGVGYILMVQRANFPNSDASEVRYVFQKAAFKALERR